MNRINTLVFQLSEKTHNILHCFLNKKRFLKRSSLKLIIIQAGGGVVSKTFMGTYVGLWNLVGLESNL